LFEANCASVADAVAVKAPVLIPPPIVAPDVLPVMFACTVGAVFPATDVSFEMRIWKLVAVVGAVGHGPDVVTVNATS
jgi:hypothetical protein